MDTLEEQSPEATDTSREAGSGNTTRRLGVVGLNVGDPGLFDTGIKDILRQHRRLVLSQSRPLRRQPEGAVMALIVQASPDELGALTGRLGMLPTVRVKSILL